MNKILLTALVIVSFPLFAQSTQTVLKQEETPTLNSSTELDDVEDKPFNPREGHWISTIGAEGMSYKLPFDFNGVRKDITPGPQELWGGRIGLGGEIYLGAGFNTTTKVEGYFVGTFFTRSVTGDPEVRNLEFAFTKKTGQVFGGDLVQSIGFMFDFKTKNPFMDQMTYLTMEPFIEAGIGYAQAYNRINYHYNTGRVDGTSQVLEDYRVKVEDGIMNQRVGGGINLISRGGFFLYLRSTVNRYDINKRKISGSQRFDDGGPIKISQDIKNPKIAPVTIYAIGGGYKF